MKLADFNYNLPPDLIAIKPSKPRDHSRLLVLDKTTGRTKHHTFYEIIDFLKPGDLLIMNNSKVFPARLVGEKALTHGKVEILLNHEISPGRWEVVGKGLKVDGRIIFDNSILEAIVEEHKDDIFVIRFNLSGPGFFNEIEKIGRIPLPPYIVKARFDNSFSVKEASRPTEKDSMKKSDEEIDREQYQTIYAKSLGSVAAPTAGLHFTSELLQKIRDKGVIILEVTLHVGLGTFAPVKENDITKHKIHSEYYSLDKGTLVEIINAKNDGRRVIAVGTTTTRALETIFQSGSDVLKSKIENLNSKSGWTDIFIYPSYQFKCVDGMVTNFHLPKSSLLMLVSAFAGYDKIIQTYNEAIKQKYRFYSYGDAMLII